MSTETYTIRAKTSVWVETTVSASSLIEAIKNLLADKIKMNNTTTWQEVENTANLNPDLLDAQIWVDGESLPIPLKGSLNDIFEDYLKLKDSNENV